MGKVQVFIVDDSPFIHKAIGRALSEVRYQICGIAKNGREGLELCGAAAPDVIIMDITMPVMDGLEASQAILKQHPGQKILMLSAMGDDGLIAAAKRIGVKAFLQKPFTPEELTAAVDSVYAGG